MTNKNKELVEFILNKAEEIITIKDKEKDEDNA